MTAAGAPAQPDTEARDLPGWYQLAESAYTQRKTNDQGAHRSRLQEQVAAIDTRLLELSITALQPARVGPGPWLEPALLVPGDAEEALYAVYATWSEHDEEIALLAQDPDPSTSLQPQYSRLLTHVADIAAARHEGPAPQPRRAQPDLRARALTALGQLNADHMSPDGFIIADQLGSLTAAVLYAVDEICGSLSRE